MATKTIEMTVEEKCKKIVHDLIFAKDLEEMRTDIRDLWDNFVIWNDTTDAEDRGNVYGTYKAFDELLTAVGKIKDDVWPENAGKN
jgi:hypothetical protein